MERPLLERAARECGIELEYHDTWGRRHEASEPALLATLAAWGLPVDSATSLSDALDRRSAEWWERPFPPTLVVAAGTDAVRLHVPFDRSGSSVKLEFQWENGDLEHHWFWLPELRELERTEHHIAKRVPWPELRLGYHRLRIYWMKEPELEVFGEANLIVHPRQALPPSRRMAGVALSLYGLRSGRNWGCGDFTDLEHVVEKLAPSGVSFLALNPLHALANREPYNTSPYLPECSLFRQFLYLDPERVPGYEHSEIDLDGLRATEFVEYESVARAKKQALAGAFERFLKSHHTGAFEEYVVLEGAPLEHYGVYCALWEEVHAAHPDVWLWKDWPEPYRTPEGAAQWAKDHRRQVDFYKFLQWQIDRQLAHVQARAKALGMEVGLYHDLPLATDRFGADLWANGSFYVAGARVGAPCDELAPGGQDWGFPPPNREAHLADGYQLFARTIRNTARHGGALRIDHVMRFFRLFWIPEELTAKDGLYVKDHVENLLGVLALESARNGFFVVGEDLGTVPTGVRETLGSMNILGYRLLWFEKHHDGSFRLPHEYPHLAAVSTTTHDLPTLAGFAEGRDIEARKAAGLVEEADYQQQWSSRNAEIGRLENALHAAGTPGDPLAFVLSTPAQVAILNQEDLTGETHQQNLPASTWQHRNWCRKMRVPVEEMDAIAERLAALIQASGR